ncbi:hypothetical protein QT317_26005 (plasmid) [Escherichia coli]|nr:hypothetical protein [Escherichia coli]MDM4967568.1 hypothetical protein [Escherichia coli]
MHSKSRSAHLYKLSFVEFVCVPAGLKENGNNDTMAIYHLSMKILSRSKGYSAVASAAYRAGEKILDERT